MSQYNKQTFACSGKTQLCQHKGSQEMYWHAGNPNLGFGCFLPHTGQWFGQKWTDTDWFTNNLEIKANKVIYQLELFAITLAFKVFGPSLTGRVVILRSDNSAIVNSISKMSSLLESAMELLQELTLTCMSLQILVKAVLIPGISNTESDWISRDKINEFLKANPESQGWRIDIHTKRWPTSWRPSMQPQSLG